MSIQIIPIQSPDILSACAALLVDAYNGEPWNDEWTQEQALEKLLCFYRSPRFMGWAAQEGEALLGCCVGNVEPYFTGDYFYLKEMFVPVQGQRKGVGSQLMAALKLYLEQEGIKTIVLFTSNAGFPFEFYLKHGFQEMDTMRMMHFQAEP